MAAITHGLEYLNNWPPSEGNDPPEMQGRFFYAHYYAVQAMYLAGGQYWSNWYPAIRDLLIKGRVPGRLLVARGG